jgi:hypothetical protein
MTKIETAGAVKTKRGGGVMFTVDRFSVFFVCYCVADLLRCFIASDVVRLAYAERLLIWVTDC